MCYQGDVYISVDIAKFPGLSAWMALAVLVAGPMMFVFPFFQIEMMQAGDALHLWN
ncbi:hypothetical protein [Paenibacillus sp. Soil522]|uniref:hypothetical protein n=1 Tax=Paenibacillus sp. Soil522 TaxID=1736388 RepID=UPI000B07D6E5|nr:hypothetical protein [Paenibacillus sp. Soil522]